jgi:hypothetical protein
MRKERKNVAEAERSTLEKIRNAEQPRRPAPSSRNNILGPFKVIKRIGRLAYQLELPPHWRVHNVFSVAQLEPWPKGDDPFKRRVHPPPPVNITDDGAVYEIERLIDKRVIKHGRGKPTVEYLVRWLGQGPEYDVWYSIDDLHDASELVAEYDKEFEPTVAIDSAESTLTQHGFHNPINCSLFGAMELGIPQNYTTPKCSETRRLIPGETVFPGIERYYGYISHFLRGLS